MNQKEKMRQDLVNELDGYFMQYVYLKDMITLDDAISSFNCLEKNFPDCKVVIQCGLQDSYFFSLARLYDKSKGTETIPKLIEKCKKNTHLFQKADIVEKKLDEFKDELETNKCITDAISVLQSRRDKRYAHNDERYFGMKMVNDKSNLPKGYLWLLAKFTGKVLNFLWNQLSDEKPREGRYCKEKAFFEEE